MPTIRSEKDQKAKVKVVKKAANAESRYSPEAGRKKRDLHRALCIVWQTKLFFRSLG